VYHLTRLPDGPTIATAEMPHMASVAVGLWVGVGGRYEPADHSGVAHFIEHLLFKGTERRSAKQISESVEGIGGYINAFTTEEVTCFHARAHYKRFSELLDVLCDMFLASRFSPADISRERGVIKEEIAMYRDQPQQLVHELLHESLWPNQPLGRPLTGTEESLDRVRRPEMLAFFKANYVASNTLLVVAGPRSHREVCREFNRYVRKFRQARKPTFVPASNEQLAPIVHLHPKKTEQAQLALGIRACSRHDERRHALRVLNAILGESMSSRLFQLLREEKGLAYSVYSSWAFMEDTGALTVSAGLDTDDVEKALRLTLREMRRIAEDPPGSAELRRARDYLIGQMELSLEGTEAQMNWVGETLLGYGKIVPPAQTRDRLAAVTASEVRAAARDFFRPERLTLALVSPLEKGDTLQKLMHW
jgi:predicted Zn-dependent peptidase